MESFQLSAKYPTPLLTQLEQSFHFWRLINVCQTILVLLDFKGKKKKKEWQITQDCSIQVDVSESFGMQHGRVPLEQNKYCKTSSNGITPGHLINKK